MQRDTLRQVVTIIGLVATLIVNALANITAPPKFAPRDV